MLTLQEVCDKVAEKMAMQGRPCLDYEGGCVYCNERNEHCAIGWVLRIFNVPLSSIAYETVGGVRKVVSDLRKREDPKLGLPLSKEEEEVMHFLGANIYVMITLQNLHDYSSISHMFSPESALKLLSNDIDVSGENWETWRLNNAEQD